MALTLAAISVLLLVAIEWFKRRITRAEGPGMTQPIVVEELTKRFGDFAAGRDVTFTAPEGAITALLGPAGRARAPCCG